MGHIIPFNEATKQDLAALQEAFAPDTSLVVSGGFPALSIKGGKFAISRNGEREVLKKDGLVLSAIEVCIVAYNPNVSKVYYDHKYEEGSADKPTCFSNDGQRPSANAEAPQSKSCATCPHSQWGSRITDSGKKAKACSDSRRIAVAAPDQLNEPMLLRIPPTSMKPLGEYQKMLANRKLGLQAVVTQISFDENSSSPLLVFKPVGLCDANMLQEILNMRDDDTIKEITGVIENTFVDSSDDGVDLADLPTVSSAPAPIAEDEPAPAPKKKAAKKEPAPVVEDDSDDDDDIFAGIDEVLGS